MSAFVKKSHLTLGLMSCCQEPPLLNRDLSPSSFLWLVSPTVLYFPTRPPPPSESRVGFACLSPANECRRCVFPRAVILAKYGMDGKRDTRSLESNSLKDHDVKEGDVFDDPRLDKLWNKVCEEDENY